MTYGLIKICSKYFDRHETYLPTLGSLPLSAGVRSTKQKLGMNKRRRKTETTKQESRVLIVYPKKEIKYDVML
ncbi:hypothetical protein Csa_015834, partial [Cucumis sativus]